MQVKSIAECSLGAFCNTYDNPSWKPIFGLLLSDYLRQVLLYVLLMSVDLSIIFSSSSKSFLNIIRVSVKQF